MLHVIFHCPLPMVSLISEEVMYCYQNDIDILIDDYSHVIRKKNNNNSVVVDHN